MTDKNKGNKNQQQSENQTVPTVIDLKERGIRDQDNIFYELSNYPGLKQLDLSNNQLTKLPNNLSNFLNLIILDLSNNPFKGEEVYINFKSSLML
jgi:Leucine-rich repeat (LRR) protein